MLFYYQWNLPQDLRVGKTANPGYPAHFHACPEILYLKAGRYSARVGQTLYELEAGDMIVLFPYQIHEYIAVDGTNRELVVVANLSALTEFSTVLTAQLPRCPVLRAAEIGDECRFALAWLDRTKSADPDVLTLRHGLLNVILWSALHAMTLDDRQESQFSTIQKVARFCEENYTNESFSAQMLADALGYSRYSISHLFARELKVSLSQYINVLRISHACRLLIGSDCRIIEIAYACGYNSLRNFNRVFLRMVGVTPSQYRLTPAVRPLKPTAYP